MFQFIFKQKCEAKLCFYLLFPKDKDKRCSKNNCTAKGNKICHSQHPNFRKSETGDRQKLVSFVITVDTVTTFILIWSQLLTFFDYLPVLTQAKFTWGSEIFLLEQN